MTVFQDFSIFGLFHVPIPNFQFITVGLKAICTLNFAFFRGGSQLLQFALIIVLGSGILWGILSTIMVLGMGLLGKL
jgi:hypothetical protein